MGNPLLPIIINLNNMIMKMLLIILMAIVFTSCASLFSTSNYLVSLESNPSESNVVITDWDGNTVYNGKTPSIVRLTASQGYFKRAYYIVSFTKEGYNEMTIPITFGIDEWYWANLVGVALGAIQGLIGFLIVDPYTGSMYRIDSDNFSATLTPNNH